MRGAQRARVKSRHIPNRSAGRAAYLAFLLGAMIFCALLTLFLIWQSRNCGESLQPGCKK